MMRTRASLAWMLGVAATISGGCAASSPTDDVLVITTRSADALDHYDVHLFAWDHAELASRWTRRIGPLSSPPRALAQPQGSDAVVVEVRASADGRAGLQRVKGGDLSGASPDSAARPEPRGAALDEIAFDTVLDTDAETLLLARRLQRTARPVLRVSRGEIRTIDPPWMQLTRVDIDTAESQDALPQPVVPIVRIAPLEWLVLSSGKPPKLQVVNARTGGVTAAAAWDESSHIAGAVVTPGGERVVLAVQRVGARWNLFDLFCWERTTGRMRPLLAGVFSANRPNANVSPALPMYAINDRHLAFVLTEVSEWRGKMPVEGQYHTAIADLQTGEVLVRIRNPQRSLRNEVPPPYLPGGRLVALRIERTNPNSPSGGVSDEEGGDSERWQPFFTFRDGQLVDVTGARFAPQSLGPYAYSRDGRALAVRERSGSEERCLIYVGRNRLRPISLRGIERLAWLGRTADAPDSAAPAAPAQ